MIDRQKFGEQMNRATAMMREGNIDGAGEIYRALYGKLCMNDYRQRLSQVQFEKVFFGLTPNEVLSLLLNMVGWQQNACQAEEALETIRQYKMIEKDFSIHGAPDFIIDKEEIEAYRRLGDNEKALELCDKLLKKDISHPQKVEVLIVKGSIECDDCHQIIGINSLSQALAEAEADGNPSLIAKCYSEMARMIGTHYPALSLSFLWKARVHYEKVNDHENAAFCKVRMAKSYFLLWHKCQQKEERFITEARRLVNEDVKREDFKHPGAQCSFDRDKGLLNNDLQLIEKSIDFFESIKAYAEVCRSAEFYIKTALTIGDREAAKYGAQRYEKAAMELNYQTRIDYIRKLDLDHAVACWVSETEQKELPNLLDVMEMIAYNEEWFHLDKEVMRLMFPTHYQEGMFEAIRMPDGRTHLYPCALYPYRYYRGQSDRLEGKQCKPSLYRGLSEAEMFHERLCLKELELLLKEYPLTRIYENGLSYATPEGLKPLFLNVDSTAIGQHYGIKTDVLDLTTDKWVAAFFAATKYENGTYLPYTEDGVGVIYEYTDMPIFNAAAKRLSAVGLQPFSRPGCQAGLVYKMQKDEDFNSKAERIFFKHDAAISELIYNYCNRSKKLFPDEILEGKVNEIKASKVYSRQALNNTIKEYYQDISEDTIHRYIDELALTIQNDAPGRFTEEELKNFDERWEKEKGHFFDSVYLRLSYSGPVEIDKGR